MKKLLLLILIIFTMTGTAYASEETSGSGIDELLSHSGAGEVTDLIPPQAEELLDDSDSISQAVKNFKPQNLIEKLVTEVKNYSTAPLKLLVSLSAVMIFAAMLEIFHSTINTSNSRNVFGIIISVAISSVIVSPVVECITEAAAVLHNFSFFIATYIPVFAGVITASGQPLTGAAYNIFLFWICQTTSQLISGCFVPLLCAYLSLAVMSIVCPPLHLGRLVNGIKTFIVWGLTLTLTVFVGLMSVQSVVASGGDNVTVKTAKFMIGSLVPGIGGALSDLFMAAQGCIQLAKGTLGAFGVIVTLFTFLPIMIKIFLWYLSLNVAALIGGVLGVSDLSGLIKNISSALGILLAVLLYDALLVIISTTIIIVTFNAG